MESISSLYPLGVHVVCVVYSLKLFVSTRCITINSYNNLHTYERFGFCVYEFTVYVIIMHTMIEETVVEVIGPCLTQFLGKLRYTFLRIPFLITGGVIYRRNRG